MILWFPPFMREFTGRDTVCVDPCMVPVISQLWWDGVRTMGCCCGHNGRLPGPNVLVHAEDVELACEVAGSRCEIIGVDA